MEQEQTPAFWNLGLGSYQEPGRLVFEILRPVIPSETVENQEADCE
jgi:hypothetical protein